MALVFYTMEGWDTRALPFPTSRPHLATMMDRWVSFNSHSYSIGQWELPQPTQYGEAFPATWLPIGLLIGLEASRLLEYCT